MPSWPDDLVLERHPPTTNASLRAWDAADEYVVTDALAGAEDRPGRWLIVNDAHGALSTVLADPDRDLAVLGDSMLSEVAARQNLTANGRPTPNRWFTPLDPLDGSAEVGGPAPLAVVIVKIPKTLALLEHELRQIRPHLVAESVIIGAGMVKHIHTSTLEVFERVIGPTTTSPAWKKARLIRAQLGPAAQPEVPAWRFPVEVNVPGWEPTLTTINHAGVFSAEKLDVGTRFLLEHLPPVDDGSDVADVGCGNGVLAAALARNFERGSIVGTDVSALAVASARATYDRSVGDDRARFEVMDALAGLPDESLDLVVTNPPFHDQRVTGDETAWRMFVDARRTLRPGGRIVVVGNRHLGHHARLRKLFGNCSVVAANPKFTVLSAERRGGARPNDP